MPSSSEDPREITGALEVLQRLTAQLTGAASCYISSSASSDAASESGGEHTIAYRMEAVGGNPARQPAYLIFVFATGGELETARPLANRLSEAIRSLWLAQEKLARYSEVALRAAELESRIIASKIDAKAGGMNAKYLDSQAAEAITRHVDLVLQSSNGFRVLADLVQGLEGEVQEREWTAQAKSILQGKHRISEEEAYALLRRTSRTSRRPIAEVARQIIDSQVEREKSA